LVMPVPSSSASAPPATYGARNGWLHGCTNWPEGALFATASKGLVRRIMPAGWFAYCEVRTTTPIRGLRRPRLSCSSRRGIRVTWSRSPWAPAEPRPRAGRSVPQKRSRHGHAPDGCRRHVHRDDPISGSHARVKRPLVARGIGQHHVVGSLGKCDARAEQGKTCTQDDCRERL